MRGKNRFIIFIGQVLIYKINNEDNYFPFQRIVFENYYGGRPVVYESIEGFKRKRAIRTGIRTDYLLIDDNNLGILIYQWLNIRTYKRCFADKKTLTMIASPWFSADLIIDDPDISTQVKEDYIWMMGEL